jgi:hypothetical protein
VAVVGGGTGEVLAAAGITPEFTATKVRHGWLLVSQQLMSGLVDVMEYQGRCAHGAAASIIKSLRSCDVRLLMVLLLSAHLHLTAVRRLVLTGSNAFASGANLD